jgi:hypothetical protein
MGLTVYVYRDQSLGDCTNNGISNRYSRLCVENIDGPCEPSASIPAVRLEQHQRGCLRIVPVAERDAYRWLMFGGNFAATSDSRFGQKCEELLGHPFYGAVKIHDRIE